MKKEFEINNKIYKLDIITVRKYYELQEILKGDREENEFKYEIASCLLGCSKKELMQIEYPLWLDIWNRINEIIEELSTVEIDIKTSFIFNDVEYGITQLDKMVLGEFADLEIIFADQKTNRLHEIAAIIYRPILTKTESKFTIIPYDSDDASSRAEKFLDLPIEYVRSANSFFLQYAKLLIKNTAGYLMEMEEMKKMDKETKEILEKITQQESGGELSIQFLERILLDLSNQQNLNLDPPSTGFRGKVQKLKKQILKLLKKIVGSNKTQTKK